MIFIVFYPFLGKGKKRRRTFMLGVLGGGVVLFVITLLHICVLGATISAEKPHSSYCLAQKINVGNFVTRIEIVMAIMWFITLYFKAALCFYATIFGIGHLFQLKRYQSLSLPLVMIVVILTYFRKKSPSSSV